MDTAAALHTFVRLFICFALFSRATLEYRFLVPNISYTNMNIILI